MTACVTFTVPAAAMGKQRPRFDSRRRITYTPKKTHSFEHLIGLHARLALGRAPKLSGPLAVDMIFSFMPPASWSKKRQLEAIGQGKPTKPDVDNAAKSILDALNGVLYDDDAAVVSLSAAKVYAARDAIKVTVRPFISRQG